MPLSHFRASCPSARCPDGLGAARCELAVAATPRPRGCDSAFPQRLVSRPHWLRGLVSHRDRLPLPCRLVSPPFLAHRLSGQNGMTAPCTPRVLQVSEPLATDSGPGLCSGPWKETVFGRSQPQELPQGPHVYAGPPRWGRGGGPRFLATQTFFTRGLCSVFSLWSPLEVTRYVSPVSCVYPLQAQQLHGSLALASSAVPCVSGTWWARPACVTLRKGGSCRGERLEGATAAVAGGRATAQLQKRGLLCPPSGAGPACVQPRATPWPHSGQDRLASAPWAFTDPVLVLSLGP